MDEFLSGPRWRERTSAESRWVAVCITFAILVVIGLVVVWGLLVVVAKIGGGLPSEPITWLALAALLLPWALRSPQPATASDYEAQPWTEYAIRSVMVGVDRPRSRWLRAVAVVAFGPPLLGFAVVYGLLSIVGIV